MAGIRRKIQGAHYPFRRAFKWFDPAPSDADVVILAGAIDLKSRGVKWANEVFQCPVIYVCGNHEYYGGHLEQTLRKMKEAAVPHMHVLENEVLILDRTRFLVTTGWTDYSSTGDVEAATRTAWKWMSDFRVIRTDVSYRRLRPADLIAKSRTAYSWLAQAFGTPFDGLRTHPRSSKLHQMWVPPGFKFAWIPRPRHRF